MSATIDPQREQERYERAKQRVKELREFYTHGLIFLVVIAGLFLINYLTSPGTWWFLFVVVAWGIGIIAHGVSVFFEDGLLGRDWEERKIRKLMEKDHTG